METTDHSYLLKSQWTCIKINKSHPYLEFFKLNKALEIDLITEKKYKLPVTAHSHVTMGSAYCLLHCCKDYKLLQIWATVHGETLVSFNRGLHSLIV